MVYLMMDQKKNCNLVKVGLSRKLNDRRAAYYSLNPMAIMRSSCSGTEAAENACRDTLKKLGKRIKGTEWFIISDEIFEKLYNEGMGFFYPNKKITFNESFT